MSLFLEILPGFQPQDFATEKMLRQEILLSRTSSTAKGRDLVSEKVHVDKLLVSEKMLGGKFLVSKIILDNNILCPSMSLGTILMQTETKQLQQQSVSDPRCLHSGQFIKPNKCHLSPTDRVRLFVHGG